MQSVGPRQEDSAARPRVMTRVSALLRVDGESLPQTKPALLTSDGSTVDFQKRHLTVTTRERAA